MKKEKQYKEIQGTFFHINTSEIVCNRILEAINSKRRIILFYGDVKTGKDWNEKYDTVGTIGRSTGSIKIPLLIKTSRSMGGGAILDNCIVKILDSKSKTILYQHHKYFQPLIK